VSPVFLDLPATSACTGNTAHLQPSQGGNHVHGNKPAATFATAERRSAKLSTNFSQRTVASKA